MNATCIAVIGMACHYPGAQDLRSFWENILTRRRQFRPFPDSRLPAADYYDPDPAAPDKTYCPKAGLLDGFAFDPVQYRIPRSTFDSADIVHWLALKVALASLDDAGFTKASVPRERTGVILGNTLTGEHSRSEGLRLRWPFVRRVVEKTALEKGLSSEQTAEFLRTTEAYYKSVFTPITEDTLAGALSNTIAGRICNYLDLHGGGYTVDGACSSSVIAAATAATHLVNRDLDLALAGGVDISLDTFEMVGFAKTAALTTEDMRVYDRRANGFMPGEGCGFVVMKRLEDAVADGDYVYAVLHGWGISSDGKGGLTAPNAQGQARALQRAYERAGWNINDVDFIEGHGTGTAVGDKTELEGIALAMNTMNAMNTDSGVGTRHAVSLQGTTPLRRCGITSLKSLIGHTKAASGVGALIKTVIALNQRILPPIANCFEPSPVFAETATSLYPLLHGEIRPRQEILRAGLSGMGFGGINSHLALASGDAPSPKLMPAIREQKLLADYQRTELFVFSAPTVEELLKRVQATEGLAQNICEGERLDLAAHLATLYGHNTTCGPVRAAITADSPEMLMERLAEVAHILGTSPPKAQKMHLDPRAGICIGNDVQSHRVGFLFPGQGSQQINMGRQLVQRHDWAEDRVTVMEKVLGWPKGKQLSDFIFRPIERALDESQVKGWQEQLKQTEIAQPALCLASMLGLEQLARLGVKPDAVGGHSLGELTAFYAAGAYSGEELINFAALRGQAMAPGQGAAGDAAGGVAGTMASLACSDAQAQAILDISQGYAVVANKNSASQTVISGEVSCIEQACLHAQEQGIRAVLLPVANAFHSRFVSQAAQVLAESRLLPEQPKQLTTALFSGLQGGKVDVACDLRRHFSKQVISPVDCISLVQEMSTECDLLLEVGPGRVLTGLARSIIAKKNVGKEEDGPTCFPLATKPEQDKDLNLFLANYFVRGGTINWHALYEDRLVRPFTPIAERLFLDNPCERPFPEHFPEQKEQNLSLSSSSLLSSHTSEQDDFGKTDRLLAEAAGISRESLMAYLEQRSRFLGSLIRVDLDNMAPSLPALEPILTPPLIALSEKKASSVDKKAEPQTQAEEKNSAELLFALIEERTGFPPESLSMDLRLLDDLNLDSIKASELIAEAANRSGLSAAKLNVSEYANATLQEVTALLDSDSEQQHQDAAENTLPSYPGWARDFTLHYLPEPLSSADEQSEQSWLHREEEIETLILFEPVEQHIAEQLRLSLQWVKVKDSAEISGEFPAKVELVSFAEARQGVSSLLERFTRVIALLPRQESSEGKGEGASDFLDQQTLVEHVTRLHTIFSPSYHRAGLGNQSLAVVQFGDGFFGDGPVSANISRCSAKALAASLHFEQPDLKVRVLDFSPQIAVDQLCEHIMAELATAESYAAVGYGADQIRRVPYPVLRTVAADKPRSIRWSPKDVVLATGGAKGITAECVLAFARATGVQLALVGRSSPSITGNEEQDEIRHTLQRARKAGLSAHYYQCDVTDAEAVQRLVVQVENEQGVITGVIHGSALNRPSALNSVPVEQALEEISPKMIGAMNLCAALREHPPQLFIAFSSLVGISGMRKNGWYGFSNEALHLFLRQYGEAEPRTATLSIAFSIWDEVGMGIRMGSTSWLRTIGVEALTVQQGTSRFLQLATHDPAADQVLVAARTSGLDTFSAYGPALPQGLRFIDRVTAYQPGVEIVSRTWLTLEDDSHIKDHCWRGTFLFPMVFGLEAMAQAVRVVTGATCFAAVCIEDIELMRPIILSEEAGAEIEIHALVLEQDALEDDPQIQVQIRTEQTNFSVDHFSATFVLRPDALRSDNSPIRYDLPENLSPLDLVPEIDLYKEGLLFQGPLYQRIQQIYQLSSKSCLFSAASSLESSESSESSESFESAKSVDSLGRTWLLGDPFLRDTLLQSGQLPIPRDLCLPARIQRIERFPPASSENEHILGNVVIEEHTEEYVSSSVTACNEEGQIVEQMTGYRAQIIEHKQEGPTAEDLVHPGHCDHRILVSELQQRETLLATHCLLPKIRSDFIPYLEGLGKEERRKKELPFIREALTPLLRASDTRIEIFWSQEGKPSLAIPAEAGVNFSLSHDQGTIICTAGRGLQGCDLETVSGRSREEWQRLLGEKNETVLTELIKQGDRQDLAGTRLWTAFEAVFKALAIRPDVRTMRIVEKKDDTVLFSYDDETSSCYILTFPVKLTLRGERMLAVVAQEEPHKETIAERVPVSGNTEAWPDRVGSFTHEFITTFLEGRGPKGKVYFTNIPIWMGELRELALLPIAERLVQDMKSGQWGMVTNRSFFTVDQQLDSYDTVVGEVRLLEDTDLSRSFLSLAFKWFKKQSDGSLVRAISGKLAITWVAVQGHADVQPAVLPEYFIRYFEKMSRFEDDIEPLGKERHSFFSKASSVFTANVSARKKNMLFRQQFLTSREDSNLVGNIYFSNYYSWQARVRDQYFAMKFSDKYSRNSSGDFVCVHAEVHHLQEAMPFEIIEVSMYLYELFAEGFTLYFEYYSVSEHGARLRKLAHGEHSAAWVPEGQELSPEIKSAKMPAEYLTHFMTIIDKTE